MRTLILICFLTLPFHLWSESIVPKGCQALRMQGQSLILGSKKKPLVFIHNLTEADVWLTHPVSNPGAGAGWTSKLQADHWSALTINKSDFKLDCIESRPGHEQQIACEEALAVCRWSKARIPPDAKNKDFWVAEDLSLEALRAAVGARGFVLPVAK